MYFKTYAAEDISHLNTLASTHTFMKKFSLHVSWILKHYRRVNLLGLEGAVNYLSIQHNYCYDIITTDDDMRMKCETS